MGIKSSFLLKINLKRQSHILGIMAICAGGWWFYTFRPKSLSQIFSLNSFVLKDLLTLFFFAIMMIPGAMALYNGIGIFAEVTKRRIKASTGSLCIVVSFLTIPYITEPFFSDRFEKDFSLLYLLIMTVVIIPVYILISDKIIRSEKMEIEGMREFIGKGILTLLAWEIWLTLSELVRAFAPAKEGYKHIKEVLWNILGFIGPILIAWAFYKIASRVLKTKDVKQDINDNTISHCSKL